MIWNFKLQTGRPELQPRKPSKAPTKQNFLNIVNSPLGKKPIDGLL